MCLLRLAVVPAAGLESDTKTAAVNSWIAAAAVAAGDATTCESGAATANAAVGAGVSDRSIPNPQSLQAVAAAVVVVVPDCDDRSKTTIGGGSANAVAEPVPQSPMKQRQWRRDRMFCGVTHNQVLVHRYRWLLLRLQPLR